MSRSSSESAPAQDAATRSIIAGRQAQDAAPAEDTVVAKVAPVWDGLSLGLVGILYGIVVTVAGVVVGPLSLLWRGAYAAVSLGLLAGLWHWRGPVIRRVRLLLARTAPN